MGGSKERPNLVVLSRPLSGARFVFEDGEELFIGSDPSCRFYLNLPQVSPFHARFRVERNALAVFDTQSMTGVWVNDDRVVDQGRVRSGDVVWLGPPGADSSLMMQYWHPPEGIDLPEAAEDEGEALQQTMIDAAPPDLQDNPPTEAIPRVRIDDPPTQALPAVRDDNPPTEAIPRVRIEDPPTEVLRVEDLGLQTEALEVIEDDTPLEVEPEQTMADVPLPFGATVTVQRPKLPDPMAVAPMARPPEPAPPAPAPQPESPTVMMTAPIVQRAEPRAAPVAPPPQPVRAAPAPPPPQPAPPRVAPPPPAPRVSAPPPRPSAPAPRRAAPVVPAAPVREAAADARPAPAGGSKAPLYAGLAFVAVLILAAAAWFALRPSATDGPPATLAAGPTAPNAPAGAGVAGRPVVPAPIEEVETLVPGAPLPTMAPAAPGVTPPTLAQLPSVNTPPVQPHPATAPAVPAGAPNVGPVLARADAAIAAGQLDEALAAYDEALRIDPQQPRAAAGRAAVASLRKTFVPTPSKFIGRPKKGVPAGFEGGEADPAYQGRIEWEFAPARVKPGDQLSIRAFLVNEGTKDIDVETIQMTTIVDGARNVGPTASPRRVPPRQRVLICELSSTWKDGVKAWILEARAVSKRDDAYWSRVTWR